MADRRGTPQTGNGERERSRNQNGTQNQEEQQRPGWFRRAAETVGIAGAAGVGVPTAATAGLTAAGFTSSGVAAGSIAAATQATIGNVAAGSAFATLQSVGATGGFAILGPVGIVAAAAAAGGYGAYRYYKSGNGSDTNPGPGPDTDNDTDAKTPLSNPHKKQPPHQKSTDADDMKKKSSNVKTKKNYDSHSDSSRRRDPEGSDERPGPVLTPVVDGTEGGRAGRGNPERRSEFQEWLHQRNQNAKSKEDNAAKVNPAQSSTPNKSERKSNEESMKPHLVKCEQTQTQGRNSDLTPHEEEEAEWSSELQILEAIYVVLAFLHLLHEQRRTLALLQNLGVIATGPELVRENFRIENDVGNVQMNQNDFGLD